MTSSVRAAILVSAMLLAGSLRAEAECLQRRSDPTPCQCPSTLHGRSEALTAEERERIKQMIREAEEIEAAHLAQAKERESPSHVLELATAALCLVSLFAIRRSRAADTV